MNDHDAIGHAVLRYERVLRWCVLPNPNVGGLALAYNRRQWLRHGFLWN
jgi:hypothetical protein